MGLPASVGPSRSAIRRYASFQGAERRRFFETFRPTPAPSQASPEAVDFLYRITYREIAAKRGGVRLLRTVQGSSITALLTDYVEFSLEPWRFCQLPRGFWAELSRLAYQEDPVAQTFCRSYLAHFAPNWDVKAIPDWKDVLTSAGQPKNDTSGRRVAGFYEQILRSFGSLQALLTAVYPIEFKPQLRLSQISVDSSVDWRDRSTREGFLGQLRRAMGGSPEGLYSLSPSLIAQIGGQGWLGFYEGSIPEALADLVPDFPWKPWKFVHSSVPKHFWWDARNRYEFFDDLAQRGDSGGLESSAALYALDKSAIDAAGGSGLLAWEYGNSVVAAVSSETPAHSWLSWRFSRVPNGWANALSKGLDSGDVVARTTARELVEDVARALGVGRLEDWYRPSLAQLDPKFRVIVRRLGGLPALLFQMYPSHKWNHALFALRRRSTQRKFLLQTIQAFPNEDIVEEASVRRLEMKIFPPETSRQDLRQLRFDIALPKLRLLIEYQGGQHFVPEKTDRPNIFAGEQSETERRDRLKASLAQANNWSLVVIPPVSPMEPISSALRDSLRSIRPDLVDRIVQTSSA